MPAARVKVSKSAVMTATSIVGLILTTDVLVAEAEMLELPMLKRWKTNES